MSRWASAKAKTVLRALLRKGWTLVSQRGSHIKLNHPAHGNYMFGFHENEEIGPKMLAKIAKHTGWNRRIYRGLGEETLVSFDAKAVRKLTAQRVAERPL